MNYLTNCLFASIGNYGYYYNTMEGSGRNQLKKYERDIVPLIVYNIHHFHVSFFVMYVRFIIYDSINNFPIKISKFRPILL